jgi:hypothetical protein
MIYKIFLAKTLQKKISVFYSEKAKICKILIITLVFEKKRQFFAENCDHNIDTCFHAHRKKCKWTQLPRRNVSAPIKKTVTRRQRRVIILRSVYTNSNFMS